MPGRTCAMTEQDRALLRRRLHQLYDEYRTAILNRKYYGHRLKIAKRQELVADLIVAIGTSSAVAGWTFWQTPRIATVWSVIGAAAALAAILKTALPLAQTVERYSKLYTGYSGLCFDIKQIIDHVRSE